MVSTDASDHQSSINRFVVPATVMLAFVSFWRASAIVLSDLGSSAYYVGGIAEQKIGKSAPWFILGIMLFSYAVRAVYIESCSMFARGGVYKVVREAMGGTAAKSPFRKGLWARSDGVTGTAVAAFQVVCLSWSLACGRLRIARWLGTMGLARR